MANKIWNLELDGQPHSVEADFNMWSGARWVAVNGERVIEEGGIEENIGKLLELGSSSYQVPIGEHLGVVTFNLLRAGFDIEFALAVDGRQIP